MASNDYAFVTRWRVVGTVAEVKGDSRRRSVAAAVVAFRVPGGARARAGRPGRRGQDGGATGDFEGRGVWTFVQAGDVVDVSYDWRIRARKPILRSLSWLLKPVFAANHRWAMTRGEESLALELRRRRAHTEAERAAIPAPPGPTRWGTRRPHD